MMSKFLSTLSVVAMLYGANAACPNSCSGHGSCDMYDQCTCYTAKTQGDSVDNVQFRNPDCSVKTCPRGISHIQVSEFQGTFLEGDFGIFTHKLNVECSDRGECVDGECQCFGGWKGSRCQYTSCVETANGICQDNQKFARDASIGRQAAKAAVDATHATCFTDAASDAAAEALCDAAQDLALSAQTDADFVIPTTVNSADEWSSALLMGNKCDSGYKGFACNLKECPSGVDPLGFDGGPKGRDCSGRGICDFTSGICACFDGYTGKNCGTIECLQ